MTPLDFMPTTSARAQKAAWVTLCLMGASWAMLPWAFSQAEKIPVGNLASAKATPLASAPQSRPLLTAEKTSPALERASYPYYREIQVVARKYQVAPELIASIVRLESNFDRYCVSPVGAEGLMQLMPETARDMAKDLGMRHYDLWDPKTNLEFGTRYLSVLLRTFHGQVPSALSFYNAGRFGIVSRGVYRNHRYIRVVMDNYWDYLRAQPQDIPAGRTH